MKKSSQKLDKIPRNLIIIAWILVFGSTAPMLDSTMVNIAINQLSNYFNSPLSVVQWTITGFVLAMGTAVPISGWLVNHFSGKKVYFWAEIAFGVTSLFSALSWNIESLITFRILQGLSSGIIMPLFITLLVDSVGSSRIGRIMSIVGIPMTLGPMVGPIIGGLLVQYTSWRYIFFINIPIVVVSSILLIQKIPSITPKDRSNKLDWIGIFLLALISSTIVYGVVKASDHGNFTNLTTIGYICLGTLLIGCYILHAIIRHDKVILPLHLFKSTNFSGSMIGTLLAGFITTGPMILLPLFFQDIRGESAIMAAVSLIPQSIGMLISRGLIGRLIDSIGPRWVSITGIFITVFGTIPFVFFDDNTNYWLIALTMFARGIGGAAVKTATQADAFIGIAKIDTASASLSSSLFQQVGSGFGSAFLATVVASFITTHHINSVTDLNSAYQNGFMWSAIIAVIIIAPSFMLTDKRIKNS
ncbi:DHA2 family efflux MFS transporter permease subunit [Pediococcus claussenii]|uniref:H+ antiporter-2 family protein n=1 Tax=Pediococcus claussenii (strain ATCC BAA-344 / DSM 14800 / JCM 18046 / KCTC 3811 / LMG 21948 / P06) TaxID=701521 RepID=G8PBN9_PEDCP|nr:DHA2 family efflux MFS transporter permease subunit [Pediococcus claussenii]AEV94788.1 H+ antiporter-2 family protein [Pediococcus claussenii ATCC BAA-344]ANZ69984.1 MFS transporter [Pediococcus claussenii]ANZ71800.1 MFS transporter [Pediococcus claussenii]KRN20967.1 hypothetical protein IV79_GL000192 [Pediococcus claussenii]